MPLRVGLAHTEVKLRRAHEHLEELKLATDKFKRDGYRLTRQDDAKSGVHKVIISLRVTPVELASLPGEFAYSVRSSLDHLAWQLALLTTNTPDDWTCFPIYDSPPKPKSRYWDSISNFPPGAVSIVDSLQPHQKGARFKDDFLWQLNKLCNIDKHQVIAVAATDLQVKITGVTRAWRKEANHATQITVPLAEKEQLKLQVSIPRVIFGEPIDAVNTSSDFEIGIERFEAIYNFVRNDVVPKFQRFFL